jgi:hypothetical protein
MSACVCLSVCTYACALWWCTAVLQLTNWPRLPRSPAFYCLHGYVLGQVSQNRGSARLACKGTHHSTKACALCVLFLNQITYSSWSNSQLWRARPLPIWIQWKRTSELTHNTEVVGAQWNLETQMSNFILPNEVMSRWSDKHTINTRRSGVRVE